MNLQDKVAIVAGGTGSLGRAVSLGLLQAGATVVVTYRQKQQFDFLAEAAGTEGTAKVELTYRDEKQFQSLASATGAAWAQLAAFPVDVTDQAATGEFIDTVLGLHGRIDILVNTVGGYAGGKTLWETDAAAYEKMLDLNLKSAFVLARAVLPVFLKQNQGCLINLASRAGYGRAPGAALYAAAKAAALALWDSLAEEVKGRGINVNSVVPSIIDTESNRKAFPRADFSAWPKPEEIARVIVFLCSEDARAIHGAAIPVYGHT